MYVFIDAGVAQRLAADILSALGTPAEVATFVADHLVDADRCGHTTHGIGRLPWYAQYVRDGVVDPQGRPTQEDAGLLPCVSANWGFSHPAADEAMRLAVEHADRQGIGAAGLIRATHIGRLGSYVEAAARSGHVGIALFGGMGGGRLVAPPGGVVGLLGANPIAIGFPAGAEPPLVIDFTTAATSIGRIVQAANAGERLDAPHLVDADGTPTDDPTALDRGGAIRSFGDHKGFALAVAIEGLTRVLTAADRFADEGFGGPSFKRSAGLFAAVRADAFADASLVESVIVSLRETIRDSRPAGADVPVRAPGDPELHSRAARGDTLQITRTEWERIEAVALELGVAASGLTRA